MATKYSVIVSHNARIRCLLGKLNFRPEHRFQNCCVLRLSVNEVPGKIKVMLIHAGYLSEKDLRSQNKTYYSIVPDFYGDSLIPSEEGINAIGQTGGFFGMFKNMFQTQPQPRPQDSNKYKGFVEYLTERSKLNITTEKKYVFYIVRHGISEHNEGFNSHLFGDTNLVRSEAYVDEIKKAANAINIDISKNETPKVYNNTEIISDSDNNDILEDVYGAPKEYHNNFSGDFVDVNHENISSINFGGSPSLPITMFVSDLLRTRQTANLLFDVLNKRMRRRGDMIVLPCSHEVAGVGNNGDCDSSNSFMSKGAFENYPRCTKENISDSIYSNSFKDCAAKWDFYKTFYDDQMRNENDNAYGMVFGKKSRRMKCRDTNMIALAIYYLDKPVINEEDIPINLPKYREKVRLQTYIKPVGGRKRRTKKIKR